MTFLCLRVSLTSSSGFGGTLSSFISEITLFYSFFSPGSDQLFFSVIGCPSVHGSPRCLTDSGSPRRRPSSQRRLSCASCWAADCWRCRGLWFSPDRNPHAWWPERWSSPPVGDRGVGGDGALGGGVNQHSQISVLSAWLPAFNGKMSFNDFIMTKPTAKDLISPLSAHFCGSYF